MSIILYNPDISNNDNFTFKYSRGETYCLDFMSRVEKIIIFFF